MLNDKSCAGDAGPLACAAPVEHTSQTGLPKSVSVFLLSHAGGHSRISRFPVCSALLGSAPLTWNWCSKNDGVECLWDYWECTILAHPIDRSEEALQDRSSNFAKCGHKRKRWLVYPVYGIWETCST